MKKDNKVDKVINEVLESERVQQAGSFIIRAFFVAIGLFALFMLYLYMDHNGTI